MGWPALWGIPDAKLPSHIELSKLEDETGDELVIPDSSTSVNYAIKPPP